jgi:predicted Zn-dependent protease
MCSRPVRLQLDSLDAAQVAAVASATPGVSDWVLHTTREQEAQLYLIGDRTEARRVVSADRTSLTVYNDHPMSREADAAGGELARGATTITLLDADALDPAALAVRLRDAVAVAALTDNPPYPLPGMPADGYPAVSAFDPALASDLTAAVDALAARVQAAVATEPGVRLSSAEVYVTRAARALRNSRGADASGQDTQVMLDLVLIASDGPNEAEMHGEFTRRRLADLDIETIVRLYATYARHTLVATTPATFRGPVILSGKALADVFHHALGQDTYRLHTSGQAAYQHISRFTAGGFTTGEEPRGDRLTLASDPLRPFGGETAAFGADGLPLRPLTAIKEGVFVGPWTDARYAAYLGTTPTGVFANPTVTPGNIPLRALRDGSVGTVYEVAEFSFLDPDFVSGDFVAEIKLGYCHDASGTHPIKGGSVAGNLFTAFADARFASETYTDGTYLGPAAIRFGAMTVSGE